MKLRVAKKVIDKFAEQILPYRQSTVEKALARHAKTDNYKEAERFWRYCVELMKNNEHNADKEVG